MYKVRICKSHNINSSPRTWEDIGELVPETEAVRKLHRLMAANGASGDELQIVDENEVPQLVTNKIHGPMW